MKDSNIPFEKYFTATYFYNELSHRGVCVNAVKRKIIK